MAPVLSEDKPGQLLVANATLEIMSEVPSAPKTSNSAMLSWPEKVDGVERRITRAKGSGLVEVVSAETLSACAPESEKARPLDEPTEGVHPFVDEMKEPSGHCAQPEPP